MSAPPAVSAETAEFRRVDLERGEFRPEIVTIINAGLGGQQINADTRSGIWLSPQDVPHGDYALVSLSTATNNSVSSILRRHCMHGGAPVLSLPVGKISIMRTEPYRLGDPGKPDDVATIASDEDVLKEFTRARTRYPDISGEAAITKPTAIVAYADKQPDAIEGANRACAEPRTFTRVR